MIRNDVQPSLEMHLSQHARMRAPASAVRDAAVSGVFFVSGAAGLIFEVVWFHRAGLVFGNSVWSTSIVLASFMGGLALGNAWIGRYGHRIRRFLLAYAALECLVAVTGVALTYMLPQLTHVLVPAARLADPWLVNTVRLATAFVALIVPSTAMGATFPVLIGALCHRREDFGRVLGRVYGFNTLGAVAGVLAAEFMLIAQLGVVGSAWFAALLDVGAAATVLWLARGAGMSLPVVDRAADDPPPPARHAWRTLAAAFLAGSNLLALEVLWFRFLSMFVINSTLAVSVMLAAVLAAIGIGGFAASTWLKWRPDAPAYLPVVALAAGGASAVSYEMFQFLTAGTQAAEWHRILWFAVALTVPTALLSGLLFTLLGQALERDVHEGRPPGRSGRQEGTPPGRSGRQGGTPPGRSGRQGGTPPRRSGRPGEARVAGWLTLANTTGAMCGPLVATFVLLPALGMERAFFAMTAAYVPVAVLSIRGPVRLHSTAARWIAVAAALAAVVLVRFPFGLMGDRYFARSAQPYAADGSRIVATREGPTETIFLMARTWLGQPIYQRLVTNGFSMSATDLAGARYMRYFVYWPMLVHRSLRRVLVISYGVGRTAGAATDVDSVESIDVVDVSRDVVAISDIIYTPEEHPLRDPRVRLHIEDGRQFLHTTGQRFDLITGEPPPPLTPGTVNLYTREYFQLVHDRLADGGIATYWLPVARRGEYELLPIIRSFCDVFDNCSLWNGTPYDWMLVGMRGTPAPVPESRFSAPWSHPVLGARLREIGFEVPEQIGATFLGDAGYLNSLASPPPLTDDFPRRLLPSFTRSWQPDPHGTFDRTERLFRSVIDTERARRAFAASPLVRRLWPEALARDTLAFFDQQRIIDRLMAEGAHPLRDIEELHALLTQTSLRRLPLWELGSNDVVQRIANGGGDGTGQVEYMLAVRTLVARNYRAAAEYFAESERRGLRAPAVRPLRAYALCLAGDVAAAHQLAATAERANSEERQFWTWMKMQCGVG